MPAIQYTFRTRKEHPMGNILIVAEMQNGSIRESSYELASFAQKIADPSQVRSLVIGESVTEEANAFSTKGGGEVTVVDNAAVSNYSAEAYRQAILAVIQETNASTILLSNTPSGWDVAPRLAAALDAAFIPDCFDIDQVDEKLVFLRRVFNGKLDARVEAVADIVVATMQPGATAPYEGTTTGTVSSLEVSFNEQKSRFLETKVAESKGVDLSKAEIIVSGGRGVGDPEKFPETIQPLADALGGAMGASRPVVDAGWLPHEYQVGSSGQIVTPKLYVACGISGAIQHLVGMKGSNFIIAINKDGDAPIFEIADLGVVGDLFEVVPALTDAVKSAKS